MVLRIYKGDGPLLPAIYPYLGQFKRDNDLIIVLFHDSGKGTIVYSESQQAEHLFGTYRTDWSEKTFQRFEGFITLNVPTPAQPPVIDADAKPTG